MPIDTGQLVNSALRASQPEKGLAIWDTSYARKQFFENARKPFWAEKTKIENMAKYKNIFESILDIQKQK